VQVNPEDLWGETRPHNTPGTRGKSNWRRKALVSLEQMRSMKEMTRHLKEISRLRAGKAAHG
jgi:4-alpha-glucanotransferase